MVAPQNFMMTASSSSKHSIDIKANGEVSRMRSHKGNMPSLPQTKYCSLCPAKFTRTTHLNRHLRSHTNERLHRCNICNAEFTRSDLLTRHKRTCGDSINANRSRRKSCQACAESKVKCNLQYPCSKCSSRGKACIFVNDPEASRNKRIASKKASQRSMTPQSYSSNLVMPDLPGSSIPPSSNLSQSEPSAFPLRLNTAVPTTLCQDSPFSMLQPSPLSAFQPPGLSSSSASTTPSSSNSSPRPDYFDTSGNISNSFDMSYDASLVLDPQLNRLFPENIFEPFLEAPFSDSPCSPSTAEFTWMDGSELYPRYGIDDPFAFPQGLQLDEQVMISPTDFATLGSEIVTDHNHPVTTSANFALANPTIPGYNSSAVVLCEGPSPAELDQYLYLFFSAFSVQVPLLHPSTWQLEGKPYILIRAMQACGALFVKTSTAMNFITDTLESTRDTLIQEFSKSSSDPAEQIHLILAVVLLQTIGLFHQQADQRISTNVYHGILVMMIRRTGLIARIGSWVPLDLTDPHSINHAWKDWVNYETIKRALFLAYLQDCCHCMYFSLSPSFQPAEFDISLPCDDALWSASCARDWLEIIQTPSPYGMGPARISGMGMQQTLCVLGEVPLSMVSLPLNPFSHFILIHTILRNIYASGADTRPSDGSSHLSHTGSMDDMDRGGGSHLDIYAAQFALHNWLQMWMGAPESMQLQKGVREPPFVYNALPFYWLAQVSLMAIQNGTTVLGSTTSGTSADGRFRLMKEWLDHIRTFLRRDTQIPTHLWDELMEIRVPQDEAGYNDELYSNGLLAFFPEF